VPAKVIPGVTKSISLIIHMAKTVKLHFMSCDMCILLGVYHPLIMKEFSRSPQNHWFSDSGSFAKLQLFGRVNSTISPLLVAQLCRLM